MIDGADAIAGVGKRSAQGVEPMSLAASREVSDVATSGRVGLWFRASSRAAIGSIVAGMLAMPLAAAVAEPVTIDQAKAEAGGVTPSDAPGFPVTLSVAGEYVLAGDLTLPDAATTAIQVTSSDVHIDLSGHEIAGVVTCNGRPVEACEPAGGGDGIHAAPIYDGISVRNGWIHGMGDAGIDINGNDAVVDGVKATDNAGGGIHVEIAGTVRDSSAERNGGYGIRGGGRSRLMNSIAAGNGGNGIEGSNTARVTACVSYKNAGHGFVGGVSTRFLDNSSYDNLGDGFHVGNVAELMRNSISFNAGWGIALTRSGRYGDNKFSGNAGGVTNGGIDVGGNLCDGAKCP